MDTRHVFVLNKAKENSSLLAAPYSNPVRFNSSKSLEYLLKIKD